MLAAAAQKVTGKRGGAVEAKVTATLQPVYHVNSNTPNDDYLIPLRLTWEAGPLGSPRVSYPKPELQNYSFSSKPVSVFSGAFEIRTQFTVAQNAPRGPGILLGKLRYQACNNSSCLPPRTLEIRLPYNIQ